LLLQNVLRSFFSGHTVQTTANLYGYVSKPKSFQQN